MSNARRHTETNKTLEHGGVKRAKMESDRIWKKGICFYVPFIMSMPFARFLESLYILLIFLQTSIAVCLATASTSL